MTFVAAATDAGNAIASPRHKRHQATYSDDYGVYDGHYGDNYGIDYGRDDRYNPGLLNYEDERGYGRHKGSGYGYGRRDYQPRSGYQGRGVYSKGYQEDGYSTSSSGYTRSEEEVKGATKVYETEGKNNVQMSLSFLCNTKMQSEDKVKPKKPSVYDETVPYEGHAIPAYLPTDLSAQPDGYPSSYSASAPSNTAYSTSYTEPNAVYPPYPPLDTDVTEGRGGYDTMPGAKAASGDYYSGNEPIYPVPLPQGSYPTNYRKGRRNHSSSSDGSSSSSSSSDSKSSKLHIRRPRYKGSARQHIGPKMDILCSGKKTNVL